MGQRPKYTPALGEVGSSMSFLLVSQRFSQGLPLTAMWMKPQGADHLTRPFDFYSVLWHFVSCSRMYAMSDKCCPIQTTDGQPFSGAVLEGDPNARNHSQIIPWDQRTNLRQNHFLKSSLKKAVSFLLWLSTVFEHGRIGVVLSHLPLYEVQIHSNNRVISYHVHCTLQNTEASLSDPDTVPAIRDFTTVFYCVQQHLPWNVHISDTSECVGFIPDLEC